MQGNTSMFRAQAKRLLELLLRLTPVAVRDRLLMHLLYRTSDAVRYQFGFPTMAGLLGHLAENGFNPTLIVDIGACVGDWGTMAAGIFRQAQIVMIDGNPDNRIALERAERAIGPSARHQILLLGPEQRKGVAFYIQGGGGSSVLQELTATDRHVARLPMQTLDSLFEKEPIALPVLLKLDVQGFELEVLRGGKALLDRAEVVILETSLLPYNKDAPLFAEVVAFMEKADLFVYDFCGQWRRQTDHTLFQTDVVFVRQHSTLRSASILAQRARG